MMVDLLLILNEPFFDAFAHRYEHCLWEDDVDTVTMHIYAHIVAEFVGYSCE